MNRSRSSKYLALVFAAAGTVATMTAGCGDDQDEQVSGNLEFRGVYRPTTGSTGGAISVIAFSAPDYRLTPSSCTEEACVESGTFTFDAQAKSLYLKNRKTGVTRTLPVEVLHTTKASKAGLVTTKGVPLLGGENQELTNGKQEKLTSGESEKLVEAAKALLEIIQQAKMDDQEMKNDQAKDEAEQAKDQAELDKLKAEADKAKAEAEKAQAEADKAKAEAEADKKGGGADDGADDENGTGDRKGGAAGG